MAAAERIGFIGGTIAFSLGNQWKKKKIKTKHGSVEILQWKNFVFLDRHGLKKRMPPHEINHQANIAALQKLNVKKIVSFCSVGSMKKEITPGVFVIPMDFISFYEVPSFNCPEIRHLTPLLDEDLRYSLRGVLRQLALPCFDAGIYLQSKGPRLETKAEIRLFREFADVIGMTFASEATLANEAGIKIAALCSAGNYANGIVPEKLDFRKVLDFEKENAGNLLRIFELLLNEFR